MIYIISLRNRRNRELAEMNTIKNKFFSIISHDLKNPVITQYNALQLLTDNVHKWDVNTLSDYSEELFKQSGALVDLLKDLLDWSLIQLGRNTHTPVIFNLVAALRSDIKVIKNMAEHKNITFETRMPQLLVVTADQNMLVTVIRNLLANAVKFTASGGMITLEITEDNGETVISVTDTGIGMSQEHIRNLFRLESAHSHYGTAGEQGSALGLIVCKELLEKHDSKLNVESTEGAGSRFWFEIKELKS
ncbi:MAG: HAMP domain-containing histidine kinase [Bacteroidetes bacterium]|nr:HAMP domain-containing histidine kinase [Bacteroidota bacterium]MCL1968763.1 HAMP domain-containing histidine kinase [Bacteroidota bacterium]